MTAVHELYYKPMVVTDLQGDWDGVVLVTCWTDAIDKSNELRNHLLQVVAGQVEVSKAEGNRLLVKLN